MEIAELQAGINDLTKDLPSEIPCGVDPDGERHLPEERCELAREDENPSEFFCPVLRARDLKQVRDGLYWMEPTLEYYWQKGINQKGIDYLRKSGFLYKYGSVTLSVDLQYFLLLT